MIKIPVSKFGIGYVKINKQTNIADFKQTLRNNEVNFMLYKELSNGAAKAQPYSRRSVRAIRMLLFIVPEKDKRKNALVMLGGRCVCCRAQMCEWYGI